MRFVKWVFVCLILVAAAASAKRALEPLDIYRLCCAEAPAISPDGRYLVYIEQGADILTDRRTSHLCLVSLEEGQTRQLTGNSDSAWKL